MLWTQFGKSVLISTHILPDVQTTCDEVVILSRGKIRLCESLEKLSQTESPSFSLRIKGNETRFLELMRDQGFVSTYTAPGEMVFQSNDPQLAATIWQTASESETNIESMIPAKNSLEEIFMATVQEAANANS